MPNDVITSDQVSLKTDLAIPIGFVIPAKAGMTATSENVCLTLQYPRHIRVNQNRTVSCAIKHIVSLGSGTLA